MSLSRQLLLSLKNDAQASGLKRWSVRDLANIGEITAKTSSKLLSCTTQRLAKQHSFLCAWIEQLSNDSSSHSQRAEEHLDTVRYIHGDTYKLCRRLLDNSAFWERFSDPEAHLVNATFLEVRARHANTVEAIVDVLNECRMVTDDGDERENLHHRADTFLQRRLGVQLLCDHHVELHKRKKPFGAISRDVALSLILSDAVLEAQHVVDAHLQIFPETIYPQETAITCTVVQPWVHHALVELLKNAMASTVAKMKLDKQDEPTAIHIAIHSSESYHTLKIVDRGIGMRDIEGAFELGHSSATKKWDRLDEQQSYAAVRSPLTSLGVGLPISRYMLEHFGGSIDVENNEDGEGCTVRARLPIDDAVLEREPGA